MHNCLNEGCLPDGSYRVGPRHLPRAIDDHQPINIHSLAACPTCKAPVGYPCCDIGTFDGYVGEMLHPKRIVAVAAKFLLMGTDGHEEAP